MIVATAGHVDHGKTLLVKALTGVDTDRLPEEKRRNLTIDLGFAYAPLEDGGVLGFVDVPGHERFIRNMLCGVAAIDYALLVVAADDGVMPQTAEHLAILDILGVREGAVAVTKTDRAGPGRVEEAIEETRLAAAGTGLAGAAFFPVCAPSGAGIPALRGHLEAAARRVRARAEAGRFRLAVDRAFTVVGAGLVVTGSVFSGAVSVGDRLVVSPGGAEARVRGIRVQDRAAARGAAGDRCALNLAGAALGKGGVGRGDWALAAQAHLPTARIDAEIRLLAGESRPLAHWTPVHVHLASADVTGRIALLDRRSLAPGESGLARLVLDRPVGALWGDRFVLRDQSARRTIGGGAALDVLGPARGRARPDRLAFLEAMREPDHAAALRAALEAAPAAVSLHDFARVRNLDDPAAERVFAAAPMVALGAGASRVGLAPARWARLEESVGRALAGWHDRNPDAVGPTEANVRAAVEPRLPAPALAAALSRLEAGGALAREGARLRLPGHRPRMAPGDEALWRRLEALLDEAGLRPPPVPELAAASGLDPRRVETFLRRAAGLGLVVGATRNRFFRPAALRRLAEAAEAAAGAGGGALTAAGFRDRTGIGRNLAIEVLEYFDRVRFTRRTGDARRILRPAAEAFGGGRGPVASGQ